jgi:hypothetical protein
MFAALERFARDHPFKLTILSLLAGFIPAAPVAYSVGQYFGTTLANSQWQENFDKKVEDEVKNRVPREFRVQFDSQESSCRTLITSRDAQLRDKDRAIVELQKTIEKMRVEGVYLSVTSRAEAILRDLAAAREKRDRQLEEAARQRFAALLADIRALNRNFAEWARLFNGQATDLAARGEIPTSDMIAFLRSFSADKETKLKVIQAVRDAINTIATKG